MNEEMSSCCFGKDNFAARAELRHEFGYLQTENMDFGRVFLRPDNSVTRSKPPPVA